jgi:hypothetical protein
MVIELSTDSLEKFYEIFNSNFHLHKPTVEEELSRRGMFNVIDHRSGMKIDFVIKKNSLYRRTEFERKRRDVLFGQDVWVVSIEDLVLSKLIWIQEIQSDRQMVDITNLLGNQHDAQYIKNWIKELGLNTFKLI